MRPSSRQMRSRSASELPHRSVPRMPAVIVAMRTLIARCWRKVEKMPGIFSTLRQQRAINVRIATITAGIRGTDLWGSSDAERDLICLLEGRITVFHPLDQGREMSEALSFYVAPKGAAPDP